MSSNTDKNKTDRSGAGDSGPSAEIEVDEYGDPIIKGAYAGQTQVDTDALTPGRQTETPANVDDPEIETRVRRAAYGWNKKDFEDEREAAAAKQSAQRNLAMIVVLVGLCFWFGYYRSKYMGAVTVITEASDDQFRTKPGMPNQSHASASASGSAAPASAGSGNYGVPANNKDAAKSSDSRSGPSVPDQRAPSKIPNRDKAMALIAEADQLIARGDSKSAEALLREALAVLGAGSGQNCWEYREAVSKLALVLHNLNRMQEEQQINDYIRRLDNGH
jgi:hypothetical protein